jgi:hypothetical protein
VKDRHRTGRPSITNNHVDAVTQLLIAGCSTWTAANVEGRFDEKIVNCVRFGDIAEISVGSVHNIAKRIRLRSVEVSHVQKLLSQDYASRLRFAT